MKSVVYCFYPKNDKVRMLLYFFNIFKFFNICKQAFHIKTVEKSVKSQSSKSKTMKTNQSVSSSIYAKDNPYIFLYPD